MEDKSTYQEPFKEEYWASALDTLKKEERKTLCIKWAPIALAALLLASLIFALKFNQDAPGLSLKALKSNVNIEQHFAIEEIKTKEQSSINSKISSKGEIQSAIIAKAETTDEIEISNRETTRAEKSLLHSTASVIVSEDLEDVELESTLLISQSIAETIEVELAEVNTENENDAVQTVLGETILAIDDDIVSVEEASARVVRTGSENPKQLNETQEVEPSFSGDDSMLRNFVAAGKGSNTDFGLIGINTIATSLQYKVPVLLKSRSYSAKRLRQSESRAQFHKKTYLSNSLKGYVGSSFLTGYGTEKGLIDWNPSVGLMYEFKLRGPWWADVGLGFQQVNGVRYQADFFADELSFGYSTVRTRVATNALYIVDIPLQLWRDFSMRSSFMFGANAEAIVNSNSGLSETSLNGDESEELSSFASLGYVQGFNRLLFGTRLGYRYRLNKRTDISLIKQFGLSEVNNGEFYLNNGNDFNNRWLLKLNFTIK